MQLKIAPKEVLEKYGNIIKEEQSATDLRVERMLAKAKHKLAMKEPLTISEVNYLKAGGYL